MGDLITIGSNALRDAELTNEYSNLQTVLNSKTGNYYKKYVPMNIDALIEDLKTLNLTKDMCILNIEKYGYTAEKEYILNCLGYSLKTNFKLKIAKRVQKQAELFSFLYKIDKNCFIRLRNKISGESRAYSIESLKDPYKLQAILKSNYFIGNVDIMYSLNCYNNMYGAGEESLFSLQNIAIDVDFNTKEYTLKKAMELIKGYMGTKIPTATMLEYGHRIRLIYTLEDVSATNKSLKLYKLVGEQIASKLEGLGATAQPATTYARIEGSLNSKNNKKINSIIFNPVVYKLRELQKMLLPEWKKDIKKANRKVVYMPNAYQLNLDRLADLEKIQTIRGNGYRECLCYLYRNYCLLANMNQNEAWERTKKFNNNFDEPLKENTLDGDTKALNRKQYLHKTETILKLLNISPEEEEKLNLKTIFSKKEDKRRRSVRDKNRYASKLYVQGKKTKQEELEETRQKIKALKEKGFKNKDICLKLDLAESTLKRHITYMKKNGLL